MINETANANRGSENWMSLFVDALLTKYGAAVQAILLYGSYTRGEQDTVLDFYVLLDNYYSGLNGNCQRLANYLLPPNVYHLSIQNGSEQRTAKYATITTTQFEKGIDRDFHSYFWGRFAQPTKILYVSNELKCNRLAKAFRKASYRMINAALPTLGNEFSTEELWVRALSLTYSCELRSERQSKANELFHAYQGKLRDSTRDAAACLPMSEHGNDNWRSDISTTRRHLSAWLWRIRKIQGKMLSLARLFKAAFTFNDPIDYVLWKVERHTGIHLSPTKLQRRHPLIFAWGLLWRIYRLGGFR